MNLVLLFEGDFAGAEGRRVRLDDRRYEYIRDVHRARVGDRLRVGKIGGRLGHGVITALDERRVEMEVTLDEPPPAALPVTLVLALPRPKVVRRVLQGVASMGVKRIFLSASWRVEKSFWDSPALAPESIRQDLLLGLEQGCDTVLPAVEIRRRFKPFVEDEIRPLIERTRALLAHPTASTPCPRAVEGPLTLAVGPEGGFTPYEVDLLCGHGFEAVSLGPRPLRVEQAVPALLGRVVVS